MNYFDLTSYFGIHNTSEASCGRGMLAFRLGNSVQLQKQEFSILHIEYILRVHPQRIASNDAIFRR